MKCHTFSKAFVWSKFILNLAAFTEDHYVGLEISQHITLTIASVGFHVVITYNSIVWIAMLIEKCLMQWWKYCNKLLLNWGTILFWWIHVSVCKAINYNKQFLIVISLQFYPCSILTDEAKIVQNYNHFKSETILSVINIQKESKSFH